MNKTIKTIDSSWESEEHKYSAEEQFLRQLSRFDLFPEEPIVIDGRIHRFGHNKSGWYILFPGEVPCGKFGDWKKDIENFWFSVPSKPLTLIERNALAAKIEIEIEKKNKEKEKKYLAAAEKAKELISTSPEANESHLYLSNKKVKNYGLKQLKDFLLLPLMDEKGEIKSLQRISSRGEKLFLEGGSVRGYFWLIKGKSEKIYIAEGYATAASVHEATGNTVFIAYTAFNIPSVAKTVREKFGKIKEIIIVVDNDDYGVGDKYASIAVQESACKTIKPPTGDANDYAQEHGVAALKELLEPVSHPDNADNWLVPASSFCTDFQPIRWLIKKIIPREGLIMVYGPSGAGKTFCVLDMCLSIATGRGDWFGLKVNSGSVVYLAGEGQMGLRKRVAAWNQVYKPEKINMFVSKNGCDLNTPSGLQKVTESLTQNNIKPDLIVVDTLHRFLLGDENSAQDTKTMLDSCAVLTSHYKCSVILVHHVGASELAQHRPRGSSSWWGALDSGLCLYAAKEDGTPIQLVQAKSKDDEPIVPISAGITSVPLNEWIDEDGDQVTSAIFTVRSPALKKEDAAIGIFNLAWEKAGKEEIDGAPYISRSAFMAYLEKENKIDNKKAASEVKRIAATLKLAPRESGWVLLK